MRGVGVALVDVFAQLLGERNDCGRGKAESLIPPAELKLDIDRLCRRLSGRG